MGNVLYSQNTNFANNSSTGKKVLKFKQRGILSKIILCIFYFTPSF